MDQNQKQNQNHLLLSLSDDILICILQHICALHFKKFMKMIETCKRLYSLKQWTSTPKQKPYPLNSIWIDPDEISKVMITHSYWKFAPEIVLTHRGNLEKYTDLIEHVRTHNLSISVNFYTCLSGCHHPDVLEHLENITICHLENVSFKVNDLLPLKHAKEVSLIHCDGIRSLNGLENAERVAIKRCFQRMDLSPLQNCKHVCLDNCYRIDVSILKNVEHLSIYSCPDILNFDALTNNKELLISRCGVEYVSGQSTIESLSIHFNKFPIQFTRDMFNQKLMIKGCKIEGSTMRYLSNVKCFSLILCIAKNYSKLKCDHLHIINPHHQDKINIVDGYMNAIYYSGCKELTLREKDFDKTKLKEIASDDIIIYHSVKK